MRIRNMQDELMISVCDRACLGKVYREGKFILRVSPKFYGNKLVTLEKAINELKKATIANLVGEKIIDECIKSGLIHEKGVIRIDGIPHAQIIKMKK
ncbi:MAG: DUF424 domain-containing protein [Promethearchaeota archaeon]